MDTYLRYMYKYKDKTKKPIQIHWLFEQYFTVIYRRDQWRRRGRCRFWNHYHFSKVNDKVSKTEGLPGKYPTLSVPHLPLWSHLPSFCLIIILWIFKGGRRGTASALQSKLGCEWSCGDGQAEEIVRHGTADNLSWKACVPHMVSWEMVTTSEHTFGVTKDWVSVCFCPSWNDSQISSGAWISQHLLWQRRTWNLHCRCLPCPIGFKSSTLVLD